MADLRALIARHDAGWNAHDLGAIMPTYTSDIVFHNHTAGEAPVAGAFRDATKDPWTADRPALPGRRGGTEDPYSARSGERPRHSVMRSGVDAGAGEAQPTVTLR
jgi:hypothetical protein